ncbi:MAG: bifunctional 5,10-methylenetetrahydrofolate dehydrogenase/5,10-methenyltetrahydrofolate cyclohydrolase [Candidatus Pacebacteria bacterium]|nr:bifunctional 5,10-methylenetetrahydrofolate dehydrogenase/5,10-methenyltetrahydrofolate cyclohydrolase [Candidatus Paceibacterota bacterium]
MFQTVDGRKIAGEKFSELKRKIEKEQLSLSLAVVKVGKDETSQIYVNAKKRELEKVGISVSIYYFPEDVSEEELCKEIKLLKEDGVIVQLPLPVNLNKQKILDTVLEKKDVDLLSTTSLGKFYKGTNKINPPVVGAVKSILDYYRVEYREKNIVLVGSGMLVGKPLSVFFMESKNTVSVLNSRTNDIGYFTRKADIIVSGAGVPRLIKGDMIKDGAVVIDAGTSTEKGVLMGDVDIESVKEKASLVSPVPGGVGPLTVYHLAENLVRLNTPPSLRGR